MHIINSNIIERSMVSVIKDSSLILLRLLARTGIVNWNFTENHNLLLTFRKHLLNFQFPNPYSNFVFNSKRRTMCRHLSTHLETILDFSCSLSNKNTQNAHYVMMMSYLGKQGVAQYRRISLRIQPQFA